MESKSFGEVYKTVFVGIFVFTMAIGLLSAIGSLFGAGTVTLNGEVVTGWKAFATAIGLSLFLSLFFSFIVTVCAKAGNSLFRKGS